MIATIATYLIQRLPSGASPALVGIIALPAAAASVFRRREARREPGEKIVGHLGRRTVDEPRADLRELAADLRFHGVGEQRVPALGRRERDLGFAVGKPRGAALPRELQRVAGGRRASVMRMVPVNFADTGPTLAATRRSPFVVADAFERLASGQATPAAPPDR